MNVNDRTNIKGYLAIWIGQLISLFGSGIVQFAIIWWLTTTTDSAFILALASFAGLIPLVVFTPISGVLADRWKRKHLILSTDFFQAILSLGFIFLFYLELVDIIPIIMILFLRGMFQAIQLPATIALVPQMVPKKQISRLNGLNAILNNIIFMVAPIAGALLLELTSIELILWIDLITFLVAVATLAPVFIPSISKQKDKLSQKSHKTSFKFEFLEGLTYLRANGFMVLILGGMLANILINPLFSLLPYYIKHLHEGGALDLALIMGFFQIGSLIGALIIMVKNFQPQFKNIVFAVFIAFSGLILLGVSPKGLFSTMTLGSFIAGLALGSVDIMIVTILHIHIPSELQGRVFSILFMLVKSTLPIAVLITGSIGELIGLSIIYILNPLLGFCLIIYLIVGARASEFDKKLIKKSAFPHSSGIPSG
ncbi:MAG: MFS transporter [Candidatus Hodarchaeales archaeon]|jgi:DHA3 family macrolide efflux protein-like MFS transporter